MVDEALEPRNKTITVTVGPRSASANKQTKPHGGRAVHKKAD